MNSFLRQSTASQSRSTPAFIDDTDFKTPETALTIANTDVKLVKNGAASVNKNSGGGTHRINGTYSLTFDATDSDTVGELKVSIVVAGALPVFMTFTVLEEAIYDALFAASATGLLPTNVTQLGADATALANLKKAFDDSAGAVPHMAIVDQGTAQSATASTLVLRSASAFADGVLEGAIVVVTGSTQGYAQTRAITGNTLSTDTITIEPNWDVTPSGTITYKVYAAAPVAPSQAIPADVTVTSRAAIADDVWNEAISGHLTAGSTGNALNAAGGSGDPWSTPLPGAYGAGTAGKIVSDMATKAANLPTDPADESSIQATLTTVLNALQVIDDLLDTEVAAIKTKTDQLTFTAANKVDANPNVIGGDPTSPPAVTASIAAKIDWMFARLRNKHDNNGTSEKVYADNGTTVIGTAPISQAGGVVTKGEFA
jgi:hypothetical protein